MLTTVFGRLFQSGIVLMKKENFVTSQEALSVWYLRHHYEPQYMNNNVEVKIIKIDFLLTYLILI